MVGIEPDAYPLADGMVMMARHQREQGRAARQAQGVEEGGAAKRLADDFRADRALVVVHHVVRAQQHLHVALGGGLGGGHRLVGARADRQAAQLDGDPRLAVAVMHPSREEGPNPTKSATRRVRGWW